MSSSGNPHQSAKLVTGDKTKKIEKKTKIISASSAINRKSSRSFYIREHGSLKMTDEGSFEVLAGRFLRIIDVKLIWF